MPALAPLIIALLSILGIQISEDAAALMAEHISATVGAVAALIYVLARAIQAWKDRR
jgi:NADH:ubiquinone oxidoreductase subunit 6 (subunit J)